MICEDMWHEAPLKQFSNHNCDGIISMNASPFERKHELRLETVKSVLMNVNYHFYLSFPQAHKIMLFMTDVALPFPIQET